MLNTPFYFIHYLHSERSVESSTRRYTDNVNYRADLRQAQDDMLKLVMG